MAAKKSSQKSSQKTPMTIGGILLAVILFVLQQLGLLPGTEPQAPPNQVGTQDTRGLPNAANAFNTAKNWLYQKVYLGRELTFYCGCKFNPQTNAVDLNSCGVRPRADAKRASYIEAEHVVPAHRFGGHLQCWQQPEKVCTGQNVNGRSCCEKTNRAYEIAQNDLHNLFPAVGEINGDRSNYGWGTIAGEKREYGRCDIEVDAHAEVAEPPEQVKGEIGRAYLYMARTYGKALGFSLTPAEKTQYIAWAKQDPPDPWETERNRRITELQGVGNPYITIGLVDEVDADLRTTPPAATPAAPAKIQFSCTVKKSCGDLQSCEEARYHLTTCGNASLDRDGDGMPCTALCGK